MVQLVLDPLARGRSAEEILRLRVCDPAIGAGAFLVEVVSVLAEHLVHAWTRARAASTNTLLATGSLERSGGARVSNDTDAGAVAVDACAPSSPTPVRASNGVDVARDSAPRTHADLPAAADPDLVALAEPPDDEATWDGEARRRIARTCVFGVDVDGDAVAAARAALGLSDDEGRGLRIADALALEWPATFPDVFARGGFDVVVGNPPYIRQERLASAGPAGTQAKAPLRQFASYDGVADLYVYFVELAHRVLRPGGAYCLIIPNKWMTAAYGRPLRRFLAAQGSVDGLVDLARTPLFADADAFPCIVWGTVGAPSARPNARPNVRPSARPINASRVDEGVSVADALRATVSDPGRALPRERWGAEPWHIETPSERALLDRLARRWPPVREVVRERPARGVVTGLNRAFVIDRATRDRLLAEEPAAAALIRRFVKGRDVRRWLPDLAERWILLVDRGTSLDELPVVRAHLAGFREALEPRPPGFTGAWPGRKPGAYAWYELQDPVGPLVKARAARLLYQDIQTAPACCLDLDGDVVPDTTVWMLPTQDRFLLALLNSPLYGWYARRRFPPALNGAVRPKHEYLQALPVAQPASALRSAIEQLVERRVALEPARRTGDEDARRSAHDLDAAIADAIADAYELTSAERHLVREG